MSEKKSGLSILTDQQYLSYLQRVLLHGVERKLVVGAGYLHNSAIKPQLIIYLNNVEVEDGYMIKRKTDDEGLPDMV